MDQIYILNEEGIYEPIGVLDEEIKKVIRLKEQKKKNDKRRKQRDDGIIQKDKGKAE